jgi:hypothetical protein
MPAACYKGLSGREDRPWFCNNCLSKTLNCIREVKSIEERCNEFMKKFEGQNLFITQSMSCFGKNAL